MSIAIDELEKMLNPMLAQAKLDCWMASARLMEQRAIRAEDRYDRLLARYVALKAYTREMGLTPLPAQRRDDDGP